jgi:hypothetical protein
MQQMLLKIVDNKTTGKPEIKLLLLAEDPSRAETRKAMDILDLMLRWPETSDAAYEYLENVQWQKAED